jgi:hypothetical protein
MEVKRYDPYQRGVIGDDFASISDQLVFVPTTLSASAVSASSAVTTVASVTAAGGQMGPNGVLTIEVYGQITNSSGATRRLVVAGTSPSTHSLSSQNYASGDSGPLYYKFSVYNVNDEANNYAQDYIMLARSNFAIDVSVGPWGAVAYNTANDLVYDVTFQLSGSGSVSWLAFFIRTNTSYGAAF